MNLSAELLGAFTNSLYSRHNRLKTVSKTEFVQLSSTCALSYGKWAMAMVSAATDILLFSFKSMMHRVAISIHSYRHLAAHPQRADVLCLSVKNFFISVLLFDTISTLLCTP
jgi:hypothetical protein